MSLASSITAIPTDIIHRFSDENGAKNAVIFVEEMKANLQVFINQLADRVRFLLHQPAIKSVITTDCNEAITLFAQELVGQKSWAVRGLH